LVSALLASSLLVRSLLAGVAFLLSVTQPESSGEEVERDGWLDTRDQKSTNSDRR